MNKMEVRLETFVESPLPIAWTKITSSEGMNSWLGPKSYEPRLGGEMTFEIQNGTSGRFLISGRIEAFHPPHVLAFTWLEEHVGVSKWPVATLVAIEMYECFKGTRLVLRHSGFEALPSGLAEREFVSHLQGWSTHHYPFVRLAKLFER
jgi:uncharacterized protein YndB with AHSA1/START domain